MGTDHIRHWDTKRQPTMPHRVFYRDQAPKMVTKKGCQPGSLRNHFGRPILSLVGCSPAEPTSVSDRHGKIQNKKLHLQPVKTPSHLPNEKARGPAQYRACPDFFREGAAGMRGEGFLCLDLLPAGRFGTFGSKPVLSSAANQGQKYGRILRSDSGSYGCPAIPFYR
ncbi:hypothetical protein SAMN05192553_101959 [Cyclobacterium xiamenense]|uniref:Uncharacterized protein n=1 Tax=Cyclobacterium xiamenense TaxID=1297121 RepID=A0A1H6V1J1_9BACT|nr:hypothetical protein SAMN05192553_101959 [Cyclobacterium xiamenense]